MIQNRPDDERMPHIVTLDFNGGSRVYRNRELGMNIPVRIAPSGISIDRARMLAETLNRDCRDSQVHFEVGAGSSETASAIRIGRTDDFDRYGAFLGLAEGIGSGDAYVLLDDSADDAELVEVIRHEAGHILGTLDHGGTGFSRYAYIYTKNDRVGPHLSESYTTYYTFVPIIPSDGEENLILKYGEDYTVYNHSYNNGTEYTSGTYRDTVSWSVEATNITAGTVSIAGGKATGVTAKSMTVEGCVICDIVENIGTSGYDNSTTFSNYQFHQGGAYECTVGTMEVSFNAVAKSCTAGSLTVSRADIGENTSGNHPTVENCTVTGNLSVKNGGEAKNTIVRYGASTEIQDAVVSNLITERGSVSLYDNTELNGAKVDGSISVRGENVKVSGYVTCNSVFIANSFGGTGNIIVKLDLRDYAVAGYTERIEDSSGRVIKEIQYFPNYTTRITLYNYVYDPFGYEQYTTDVSYGIFDNRNGRFDMDNWGDYRFVVDIGSIYSKAAVNNITLDFGGTERLFDSGELYVLLPECYEGNNDEYVQVDYQPATKYYSTIPFETTSNKGKWRIDEDYTNYRVDWLDSSKWSTNTLFLYNPAFYGEAEDVLWLENGMTDDTEYIVPLPPDVMGGNLTNLTTESEDGGGLFQPALQRSNLVVSGAIEGNITITATDSQERNHECELDLWVVPETIPVFGKKGASEYSKILRKMQKDHTSQASATFVNVHTKLRGLDFDLTETGVNLSVNWAKREVELKFHTKLEWKLAGGLAGSGRQLKLVIDLSGDKYISITYKNRNFSWDLVGELKVPDFKVGQFQFSNMWLKLDTSQTAFSLSGYIQLPWLKYSFGGDFGIVDGCIDSMHVGADNLKVPLGKTGLLVQSLSGGFSGMATLPAFNFDATIGVTFGPKKDFKYLSELGIGLDDGEFYLAELVLKTQIATDGAYTGTATLSAMAGFFTGEGQLHIYNGDFSVKGNFFMMGKCIQIAGSLNATDGKFTISGKGSMTLPHESKEKWGPLAGTGMSVNAFADFSKQYLVAWSVINVFENKFTVGFRCTFDGDVELLGASDLLTGDDQFPSDTKSLRSILPQSESVAAPLRGDNPPSATKSATISDSGMSIFQFQYSISDTYVSLSYDGVEYTRDAIAAGMYDNMQIVNELTSSTCITIAVNNASLGEWTLNAYGDAETVFSAYTLANDTAMATVTGVELGKNARSATISYALSNVATDGSATISLFRSRSDDEGHTGALLDEAVIKDSTGSFEYALAEEEPGGDYSFYVMIPGNDKLPVYSNTSGVYRFVDFDIEAPDQIQSINAVWSSVNSTLDWETPYDNISVAGYKFAYRIEGTEEWTEVDLATPGFVFDNVPNATYEYRVAACDAAGNIGAWSEEKSILVLTAANAAYTSGEVEKLEEYESAANVAFSGKAADHTLITSSTLGDAEIRGIVENTVINGSADFLPGAQGYSLTVNGELLVGVNSGIPEPDDPFAEVEPKELDGNAFAVADSITVAKNGTLKVGSYGKVSNITVASGGVITLTGDAEFTNLSVAPGGEIYVSGVERYDLTDDITTAGKFNNGCAIFGNGHKIHFEQYRQTEEYDFWGDAYTMDQIALVSDIDKFIGNMLQVEIDSNVYGDFKIADKAEEFDGTIIVVDHADGSSAAVGFDTYSQVGNALCSLIAFSDGLYLKTFRLELNPPTVTVEDADNNLYDTIYLSTVPSENSGPITKYTYRYSLNADMSDAVVTVSDNDYLILSKYDLVDNATYYVQASVENENGAKSLWSDAVSFTVVPKLLPDAPTTLTVSGATDAQSDFITFTATGVDNSNYTVNAYRFRYADNPEMDNAIIVTTNSWNINYASINKSGIVDGQDYYVQAGVKQGNEWSYWSDIVVFNTQGYDYENITIGPEPDGDFNYFSLDGSSAKNVTVIDGGCFYGGGQIDGLTIEAGGFFRDDGATVTNAVINGGEYWLYSGSVTDLVVNSGELRLMDGVLNGTTIGVDASVDLSSDYTPTITGTILIQGSMTVYIYHSGLTTDASFVFDLGAHEAETMKDKMFIDFTSPLLGSRTFTVKLDDTPEAGDYTLTFVPNSGEFYSRLAANDGTDLGLMSLGGEAILHNGMYYSLIDQDGFAYLHVSGSDAPSFIGKVKLSKNGIVYNSSDSYKNLAVSASDECDYALVEAGGQLYSVVVGDGGAVDLSGTVYGATVCAGGVLTMKEGSLADNSHVNIQKGGTVVIEGGTVTVPAQFDIAGTLTVNGILKGYEKDTDDWDGTNYHRFAFMLDQLDAPADNVMISDYSLLDCNPEFTATVSSCQAEGEYKLAGNAATFTRYVSIRYEGNNGLPEFLWVGDECSINGTKYALSLKNDVLTLTIGEDIADDPDPFDVRGDRDGNGISDVMFVWTGYNYAHGYWMNGTADWWSYSVGVDPAWDNLGSYDMNMDGKADAVMVGNVVTEGGKGAYIGSYSAGDDVNSWMNIGYLPNAEDIAWRNKVGNLTGTAGANSIVWYAPELYALGAWIDGTDTWVGISAGFGGPDWTLAGCGDFNGDGKDDILMMYGGCMFYSIDIDGNFASLGGSAWYNCEVRAIGDFSGDGKDDIVIFDEATGGMYMLLDGNADNYAVVGQLDPGDWFVAGCGDYNGDKQDDLLVRQYSTGMLGYYASGVKDNWTVMGYGVGMEWTVIA